MPESKWTMEAAEALGYIKGHLENMSGSTDEEGDVEPSLVTPFQLDQIEQAIRGYGDVPEKARRFFLKGLSDFFEAESERVRSYAGSHIKYTNGEGGSEYIENNARAVIATAEQLKKLIEIRKKIEGLKAKRQNA